MKRVIVTSSNIQLIKAFHDSLVELGIPSRTEWNTEYSPEFFKSQGSKTYLLLDSEDSRGLQYHNHDCRPSTIYNLPNDWDIATKEFQKLYKETTNEVSQEEIIKSGLKIGDSGKFADRSYLAKSWKGKKYFSFENPGTGFADSRDICKLTKFEKITDFYGIEKSCAVCDWGDYTFYFPLDQFTSDITIRGYKVKVENSKVAFGCQNFTKSEIQAYMKLLNKEIDAKIQIGDTVITKELLEKLLKLF